MEEMVMLKGTIEYLQIGLGRVSLLSGLSGSKSQNIITLGHANASHIEDLGMAASSLSDEICELQYFACYIGEDLVQGVLPNCTFQEGDEVDVVVQRSGSKNYVMAISRKKDDMMWIPLMMDKSIGATFLRSVKHVLWLLLIGYLGWGVFELIDGPDDLDQPGLLLIWSIPAVGSLIMGIWDFAASYTTGMKSTAVFRLLGLSDPYWINLSPYSLLNLDNDPYGECVYRYRISSTE